MVYSAYPRRYDHHMGEIIFRFCLVVFWLGLSYLSISTGQAGAACLDGACLAYSLVKLYTLVLERGDK